MKKMMKFLMLIGLCCTAQSAFAAGFLIAEQSVSAQGTSNASRTVGTDDATIVWSNPAGMTSLKACNDAVFGGFLLFPNTTFKNHDSENIVPPYYAFNLALPKSTNGGQVGESALVPNMAYAKKLGSKFSVGLTINSPFGLATDYNDEWYGRYYATRSQILTININPAIAYKLNDCISIGAGFSAQYFHAMLKNMINFRALAGGAPLPDGEAKVKGNCWGYGGNVGILMKFNCDKSRIGVHYRSQIRQHVADGRVKFKDLPAEVPEFESIFVNAKADTKILLPDVVNIGVSHQFLDALTLYADFQWTHWSTIKSLFVKFSNVAPAVESEETILKWKDVWQFCVGFKYQLNCQTALRAGYLYDQSPTPNSKLRTPRLPDEDRQWASVGLQYNLNDWLSVDLAYTHVWFKDAFIDYTGKAVTDPVAFATRGGLRGKYKSYTDILGAQAHLTF